MPVVDSRASGLGMILLVGGMLPVVAAVIGMTVVPLTECPECAGLGWSDDPVYAKRPHKLSVHGIHPKTCQVCRGRGSVTLLQVWTLTPNAPAQ
jgi:hypothetical protein